MNLPWKPFRRGGGSAYRRSVQGSAVVVGGGIAGLAVARALLAGGWDVQVRERAAAAPSTGASLGMWPHAVAALEQLGLRDLVRAGTVAASSGELLRPDGRRLVHLEPPGPARLVARPQLLAALAEGLPPGVLRWGAPALSAAELPAADVLVAADGVGSVVRRDVFGPASAPRPLGTVAVRGTADVPPAGMSETWGAGRMFGTTARLDGRTNVYACFRSALAAPAEAADPQELLRRVFAGWHAGVVETVEHLQPDSLDVRPLLDLRPLRSTVRGTTVLVGDAAHAMAPNLGRGACESLVDAVVLARHLVAAPDVATALRGYDRERRRPAARLVRASRLLNRVSTAEHLTGLRDGALALTGRVLAGRR
nr:FAD-dependent monooxygenase [Kineococcus vitellinus]